MTEDNGPLARGVAWVTGARPQEAARVLLVFLALHFLLISYYLIKPLRNSQFLKEFDPDFLPVVTFGVVVVSFVLTKVFNYLADRVEKYRLVAGTYIAIMVLKVVFGQLLLAGSKAAVVAFYFFGSTYFLLAIATMWACANDIFTPAQGERCYGFIAVGSSTGGIVGSWISGELARSPFKNHVPECSAISMAIALTLILLAARRRRQERAQETEKTVDGSSPVPSFWSDLAQIVRRPYVRRIGIMVMVLAAFNSSLDYISNRAIDRGVTQQQYARLFPYLGPDSYQTVYELKQKSKPERAAGLAALALQANQPATQLDADYAKYQTANEEQAREVFSDVYRYQGILGIFMLLVVARIVFRYFGVRYATVILPLLATLAVMAFALPLGLLAVQAIMVVVGSANYSLNNAAKELLYTASDEETKFKYKPMIEGPGMRFGDATAALITLAILQITQRAGWSDDSGQWVIQLLLLSAIAVWIRAAYLAGKEYDLERRRPDHQLPAASVEPTS